VNNQVSSASEGQNLKFQEVIMCCQTPEGAVIREHGIMLHSRKDREI